jgi:hypothetical protein
MSAIRKCKDLTEPELWSMPSAKDIG